MARSKEIKIAAEWCRKARNLLKIPRERLWDKASLDSEAMDKAIKGVEALIKKLQSEKKTGEWNWVVDEFKTLSALAEKAVYAENAELAKCVTAGLEELAQSGGIYDPVQLKKVADKQKLEFDAAMARAELLLQDLSSKTIANHSFVGRSIDHVRTAKSVAEGGDYLKGLVYLGFLSGIHQEQIARYNQYLIYPRKLEKTQSLANLVHALGDSTTQSDFQSIVDGAEKKMKLAGDWFAAGEYSQANQALDEATEEWNRASSHKSLPKKEASKLIEKKKKLENAIDIAREKRMRSGELYGANIEEIATALQKAKVELAHAESQLKSTGTSEALLKAYDQGIGHANRVTTILEEAHQKSADIKKKDKGDKRIVHDFSLLMVAAQKAHDELGAIQGAEDYQAKIALLLFEAKRLTGGDVRQYSEAFEKLKGFRKHYDDAKKLARPKFEGVDYSKAVTDYLEKFIQPVMKQFKEIAPSYAYAIREGEVEEAKKLSLTLQTTALDRLYGIFATTSSDVKDLQKERSSVAVLAKTFDEEIDELKQLSVPVEFFAEAESLASQAHKDCIPFNEWSKALQLLTDANFLLIDLHLYHSNIKDLANRWKQKHDDLTRYRQVANNTQGFSGLPNFHAIVDGCSSLLLDSRDIVRLYQDDGLAARCEQRYQNLKTLFTQLENALQQSNLPTQSELLKQYSDLKNANDAEVRAWYDKANSAVAEFEKKIVDSGKGIDEIDARNNRYREEIEKNDGAWLHHSISVDPKLKQESAEYKKSLLLALAQRKKEAIDQYDKIIQEIGKEDIEKFRDELLKKGQAEVNVEKPKNAVEWTRAIESGLSKLKALGVKTDALEKSLKELDSTDSKYLKNLTELSEKIDSAVNENHWLRTIESGLEQLKSLGVSPQVLEDSFKELDPSDPNYSSLLKSLAGEVDELIAEAIEQEINEARELVNARLKITVDWPHKFRGVFDQLKSELHDAVALFKTKEPLLIAQAKNDLAEFIRKFDSLIPKEKGEKTAQFFKPVEELITELGGQLGTATKNVVHDFLPILHADLNSQLNKAIEFALRSTPEQGLQELAKLKKPIENAVSQAQRAKDDTERFKVRKKGIESLWKETRKATKTLVTEKTKEFALYFQARLEDADAALKMQGGVVTANEILNKLEKDLQSVLNDPIDPRAKIFELNSKSAQEQTEIKIMARQFSLEMASFKENIQAEVKKEFEKKIEKETTKEGKKSIEEESKMVLTGMDKVLATAKGMVKPYLALLETNRVKKAKGEPAPDMKRAKGAFQQARNLLANQEQMGRRLIENAETTNVRIQGDLKKVWDDWKKQSAFYSRTIDQLSKSIVASAKEIEKDSALKGELKGENVKKAAAFVGGLARLFPAEVFDDPMKILLDDKSTEEARRAAREQVLRQMRLQRDRLLKNPWLRKIGENPIDAISVMTALSYLRTTLKRIEIETLVGV